jgi:hypothetical protein
MNPKVKPQNTQCVRTRPWIQNCMNKTQGLRFVGSQRRIVNEYIIGVVSCFTLRDAQKKRSEQFGLKGSVYD